MPKVFIEKAGIWVNFPDTMGEDQIKKGISGILSGQIGVPKAPPKPVAQATPSSPPPEPSFLQKVGKTLSGMNLGAGEEALYDNKGSLEGFEQMTGVDLKRMASSDLRAAQAMGADALKGLRQGAAATTQATYAAARAPFEWILGGIEEATRPKVDRSGPMSAFTREQVEQDHAPDAGLINKAVSFPLKSLRGGEEMYSQMAEMPDWAKQFISNTGSMLGALAYVGPSVGIGRQAWSMVPDKLARPFFRKLGAGLTAAAVASKLDVTDEHFPETAALFMLFEGAPDTGRAAKRAGRVAYEKATKRTIEETGAPKDVFVSAEKVKDMFQTGEMIGKDEAEMVRYLGMNASQYKTAIDRGLHIRIPAEKIITYGDRPWVQAVKKAFGMDPYIEVRRVGEKPDFEYGPKIVKPKVRPEKPAEPPRRDIREVMPDEVKVQGRKDIKKWPEETKNVINEPVTSKKGSGEKTTEATPQPDGGINDEAYLAAIENGKYRTAQRMVNDAFGLQAPKTPLPDKQISDIVSTLDFATPRNENTRKYLRNEYAKELKKNGIEYIDAYHVTDKELESFGKKGIKGTALDYIGRAEGKLREPSVYLFLDPDDIPTGYHGITGAKNNISNIIHVKIPVSQIEDMLWDSNFNVSFGTYSSVRMMGNIPQKWIKGQYKYAAPFVLDENKKIVPLSKRISELPNQSSPSEMGGKADLPTQELSGAAKAVEQARISGTTSPGTARLAQHLLTLDPTFDQNSTLEISDAVHKATPDIIKREGLDPEGEYAILGKTVSHIEDAATRTAISLYKGHDADTLVEEWYHRAYDRLNPKDKAAYDAYHKKTGDTRSPNEHFAQEGRDFFFSDKLHEAAGGIRRIFEGAREALKALIKRVRELRGAKIPKKIQEMYRRAGRKSGEPLRNSNEYEPDPGDSGLTETSYQIRLFNEGKDVDCKPITNALMKGKKIGAQQINAWLKAARAAGVSKKGIDRAVRTFIKYNKMKDEGPIAWLPVPVDSVVLREGVLNTPAVEGVRRERLDNLYQDINIGSRSSATGALFEGGEERTGIPKEVRGLVPQPFLNIPITQPRLQTAPPSGHKYPLVVTGNPHLDNFRRPHKGWDNHIKVVRVKPVLGGNAKVTKAVTDAIRYAQDIGARVLITTFRAKQPWILAKYTSFLPTDPNDPNFSTFWKENPNPKPSDPKKLPDWTPYVPRNQKVADAFRANGWDIEKNIYGTGGTWWWPKSKDLDPEVQKAIGKTELEYCDLMHQGCPSCRNCQKLTYPDAAGAPIIGVTDEPFCEHGCPQCFVRLGQSGVGGRGGISLGQNAKQAGFGKPDLGDIYKQTVSVLQGIVRPAGSRKVDYVSKFMHGTPADKMDAAMSLFIDGEITPYEFNTIREEIGNEVGSIADQILPEERVSYQLRKSESPGMPYFQLRELPPEKQQAEIDRRAQEAYAETLSFMGTGKIADLGKKALEAIGDIGPIKDLLHNMGIRDKFDGLVITDKDYVDIYKYLQMPHDVAIQHPEFKPLYDRQRLREISKTVLDHAFAEKTEPYFKGSDEDRKLVDRVLIEGEQQAVKEFDPLVLRQTYGLNDNQIAMYHAVRDALDAAGELLLLEMEEAGVKPEAMDEFKARLPGYVPHKWYGNWAVIVRKKGGKKTVFMTKTTFMDRYKERDRVQGLYPGHNVFIMQSKKIPYEAYQDAAPWAVNKMVDEVIERAEVNPAMADELKQALSDIYKSKGFGQNFIKRKGTPGWTEDLTRPLAEYFAGFNGYITKMKAIKGFAEDIKAIDPKRKPNLYRYALDYIRYVTGDQMEFGAAKQVAYIYYLYANVKSAAVNMTGNILLGWPILSKHAKFSGAIMAQAMVRAAHPKMLSEGEKKMLADLEAYGYLDPKMAVEMGAFTSNPLIRMIPEGARDAGELIDIFQHFEAYNRRAMAVACYDAGIRDLWKIADLIEEAHFRYSKGNRPHLMRGLLSPIMVFRSWAINYITWLKNEIKDGRVGTTARSAAAMLLLGGLAGFPMFKLFKKIWIKIFGEDPETSAARRLGKAVTQLIFRGIPSKLGISFTGSIGLGDILPTDLEGVGGVFADVPGRVARVSRDLSARDYVRALEDASPEAIRQPMAAYRSSTKGDTTRSGAPIYDPTTGEQGRLTRGEAVVKSLGFQPIRSAERWDLQETVQQIQDARAAKKQEWANRYVVAMRAGDKKEVARVVRDINEYNKKMKAAGRVEDMITKQEILSAVQSRRKAGVPPKYLRPKWRKLLEGRGISPNQ